MTGDLRSSILTTAAVAASVAGLTVIQPLTAAPPLLLAALLMDGDAADYTGIADTIQGKLLPADGKAVIFNFLTSPFGIWNALDGTRRPDQVVPSTTLGVANSLPFMAPPVAPAEIPPALAPIIPPALPGTIPVPVVGFELPSLQIGDSMLVPPPPPTWNAPGRPVVTSYEYDLGLYAPASLLNPLAWTNSVAAYLERTLTGAVVPVNPDGSVGCNGGASECHVQGGVISQFTDANGVTHIKFTTASGAVVQATVETRDGVTYVTYEDDGALPLVRPLRDYGGLLGNELADVLEPALTALVFWGYRDAIGDNDSQLLPSVAETIQAVLDFIVGVKEGLESLLQPHAPEPTTAALAAPADDTELAADAAAPAAPAAPDDSAVDGSTAPTPEPLKPVAISFDDAVSKLTDIFQQQPSAPESDGAAEEEETGDGQTDEGDTGETPDSGDTDDTDDTDADDDQDSNDGDSNGGDSNDGADDDAAGDTDSEKPDRVQGGPNGASGDSGASESDAKDSAAE